MTHNTPIKDVSDTSFWVAYYRAKESERPDALFHDPLAKKLVGERGKKISDSLADMSRYTEWSVIARTVIIDRLIEQSVKDGVDAIINLGAGLDARPYRLNLPENLEWIEVDHPNIIAHKNETLKLERPKCKLTRIQLDLADRQKRKTFFDSAVPHAEKVLILTEGVIVYLSPEQVAEISNDLSAQPRFKYWVAEYLHPRVYRHLKNPAHAKKMKNAPFKFFPDDWFGYFKNLGWIEKETRCSGEIATEFKRKQPMPIWAALLMAILPKKTKEKSFRVAGYVIFKRG